MKLEVWNISYQYRERGGRHSGKKVFEDFSMTAESQERVGILAPSGYGKTTLCKLMAGYLTPDQGQILLEGEPIFKYSGYCPVQMIWQHPELAVNPRLKIREILEESDQVEERILRELGIRGEWMDRFPQELSGGELQRVCIARALGRGTRFLLADEITTMLDLVAQEQIWDFLIRETKTRGIGLIVVSHHPALLDRICTRQVRLDETKEWHEIGNK